MNKKIKVLLVEDNEDERLFMKIGFTQEGHYEIIAEASDGNEAYNLISSKETILPELVITDLNMPGKNGYEVIQDFKANKAYAHIPVVVLTTAPYVPYAERCKLLGACAYFSKPDTFLDYKAFAGKIYTTIIEQCLRN
jgi:CheY-like chemotaxis protein